MATDPVCNPSDILDQMRTGDPAALESLTRCYGDRLFAVGRRYCRDVEDARDAVQDSLLAAGEHLTDFRGGGSPEGWLVRMVANACRRMTRGQKNDRSLHADVDRVALASPTEDPETLSGRGEVAQLLGEVLNELDPRDRAILLLAEAEDWTAPEIAESLDMSPGAVRTRLSRVRAALRPRLEPLL